MIAGRTLAVLCLLAVGVLGLSAADASALQVEAVAAGVVSLVGLWALAALKKLYDRINTLVDAFPDVQTALWGARDANGRRDTGGLVRQTQEIQLSLERIEGLAQEGRQARQIAEDAKLVATTTADAFQTFRRTHQRGLDR